MPRNTAQWTGFAVTVIVVLGRDFDILTAIPLGLATCILAGFFTNFPELPVLRRIRRN